MDLKDLELVGELKRDLEHADKALAAFEAEPGPTVTAVAATNRAQRHGPIYEVELLPVDKAVAVSAAQRQRSKIVAQLQSLGVTVS